MENVMIRRAQESNKTTVLVPAQVISRTGDTALVQVRGELLRRTVQASELITAASMQRGPLSSPVESGSVHKALPGMHTLGGRFR